MNFVWYRNVAEGTELSERMSMLMDGDVSVDAAWRRA